MLSSRQQLDLRVQVQQDAPTPSPYRPTVHQKLRNRALRLSRIMQTRPRIQLTESVTPPPPPATPPATPPAALWPVTQPAPVQQPAPVVAAQVPQHIQAALFHKLRADGKFSDAENATMHALLIEQATDDVPELAPSSASAPTGARTRSGLHHLDAVPRI